MPGQAVIRFMINNALPSVLFLTYKRNLLFRYTSHNAGGKAMLAEMVGDALCDVESRSGDWLLGRELPALKRAGKTSTLHNIGPSGAKACVVMRV